MSEETKEKPIVDDTKEGLKIKSKPKKLVDKMPNNVTHIDLSKDPKKDLQEEATTKVEIPTEKIEEVKAETLKVSDPICINLGTDKELKFLSILIVRGSASKVIFSSKLV